MPPCLNHLQTKVPEAPFPHKVGSCCAYYSGFCWSLSYVMLQLVCVHSSVSLSCFISPWFDDDPFDWDGRLRHQRVNRPRRTQRPQRRCQQRPSKQKGWRHESYRQCNMKTFTKWRISKLRWRLRGRGRTVQCLCGLSFLVIQKTQFQKQTLLK